MTEQPARITAIHVGDGGLALFAGSAAGDVAAISAAGPVRRYAGIAGDAVRALHATRDLIIAGTSGGHIRVWSRQDGKVAGDFAASAPIAQCAIVAPGLYVSVDATLHGHLWTTAPAPIAARFERFGVPDPDHLTLLSGFAWMRWERATNAVALRKVQVDGTRMLYMDGQTGLSANGRIFYVYWDDMLMFDVPRGALIRQYPIVIPATASALSDDGARLIVGGAHGEVMVIGEDGTVRAEARSGDGRISEVAIDAGGIAAAFIDGDGRAAMIDATLGTTVISADTVATALAQ